MIPLQLMSGVGTYIIIFVIFVMILVVLVAMWGSDEDETEETSAEEPPFFKAEQPTPTMRRAEVAPQLVGPLVAALKNPDWEARGASVVALGLFGDMSAFPPLVSILLNDANLLVRESAIQSLVKIDTRRAVVPLTKVIDLYLSGDKRCPKEIVLKAAETLGGISDPSSLTFLRSLQKSIDKVKSPNDYRIVSRAIRKIGPQISLKNKRCMVCNLPLVKDESLVRCPSCGNIAHRDHMLEWLHIRGYCPVCHQQISERQVEPVQAESLAATKR